MQKTIKNLQDLIDIFPSLTIAQIMSLYRQALRVIDYYNSKLDPSGDREQNETYLNKISEYLEYTDFLSGYLARCYCVANGFNI